MPRERNPNRDKAREIWLANTFKPLGEIADELGESASTIRKWKALDEWERLKESAPKNAPKGGAPKGNKNAKGHGAPKGSQNNLKHGGYSDIYWDTLDEEERAMIESMPEDEEAQLIDQIKLLTARERRLMQAINKYKSNESGQEVAGTSTWEADPKVAEEDREEYERLIAEKKEEEKISYFYQERTRTTGTEATYKIILRLEQELTSVQRAKTKAIETLMRYNIENSKLDIELMKASFEYSSVDEGEDDGFIEALGGKASEVWGSGGEPDEQS